MSHVDFKSNANFFHFFKLKLNRKIIFIKKYKSTKLNINLFKKIRNLKDFKKNTNRLNL